MFTGIIEELGIVKSIRKGSRSALIQIEASTVLADIKIGDSIAVNGICLTASTFDENGFTAEAMAETLNRTNLGKLKSGDHVNLERALRLSDRFGGHLVSGHIDGVGRIVSKQQEDIALIYRIAFPSELAPYIISKGSVAIEGISLTVIEANKDDFTVSIIPHTRSQTNLRNKGVNDTVNLETDIIAKYLEGLLKGGEPSKRSSSGVLDMDKLAKYGYIK